MYWNEYLATDKARKKEIIVPGLGIKIEVFPLVLTKKIEIAGAFREKKEIAFWTDDNSLKKLGYSFSPSFLGKNAYIINSGIKSVKTEMEIPADNELYIVDSKLDNVKLDYRGKKIYARPKNSAIIRNSNVQNTSIECEDISINNAKIQYCIFEGDVEIAPQNGCNAYLNSLRIVDTKIRNTENVKFVCPCPLNCQKGYLKWYLPMRNVSISKQSDFISERCTICDEPRLSDMYSLLVIYQSKQENKFGIFLPGQNCCFSSNSLAACLDDIYEHRYGDKIIRKDPIVSYLMMPGVIEREALRANPKTNNEMVQLYANFLGLICAIITKSCDRKYLSTLQNDLTVNIKAGRLTGFMHPFQVEDTEGSNIFPKIENK